MNQFGVGFDIGSTCTKVIVIDAERKILKRDLLPTGWSPVETASVVWEKLHNEGYSSTNSAVVATGYGRVSVSFADRCITEITCHAKGACYIFHCSDINVIDIGGQDTKLIVIRRGMVEEFVMNDKCSAGTGRFLEIMANTLSVSPGQLCEMASKGKGTRISSLCTVFAESEVISLIGAGTSRENISYAVVDSIVQKVLSQSGKIHFGSAGLCLTGGLCDFPYFRDSLSRVFGTEVLTAPDARYAGAIGAALAAIDA